ncbi:hypothetical protein [Streptomyces indicus]|uniref:Uncharacterized protein n=1 Tax=Streptomyces indicus TaxID=417292 RepID=A0A1G9IUZ8_9ACTN|nr:hypothetical protein [Streptomyces indicus]SDL28990.1 hypothetical protein SAMN05421806_12582 [Streptomyces indicus]
MSIAQDVRTKFSHRGMTPWQLVQKIGRLEREANEAACQLVAMATEIEKLKRQRNRAARALDDTRIQVQRITEDDTRLIKDLRRQITDLKRKLDIGVKAEHVIAKTQEIDGDQIRKHCVMPLAKAPFASTDPAGLPPITWGRDADATQKLPEVRAS